MAFDKFGDVIYQYNESAYSVLGLERGASPGAIKKAYIKLARKYHPDKTKGDLKKVEMFKKVSSAYAVLSDEEAKLEYDDFLNLKESDINWSSHADTTFESGGTYRMTRLDLSDVMQKIAEMDLDEEQQSAFIRFVIQQLNNHGYGANYMRDKQVLILDNPITDSKMGVDWLEWIDLAAGKWPNHDIIRPNPNRMRDDYPQFNTTKSVGDSETSLEDLTIEHIDEIPADEFLQRLIDIQVDLTNVAKIHIDWDRTYEKLICTLGLRSSLTR